MGIWCARKSISVPLANGADATCISFEIDVRRVSRFSVHLVASCDGGRPMRDGTSPSPTDRSGQGPSVGRAFRRRGPEESRRSSRRGTGTRRRVRPSERSCAQPAARTDTWRARGTTSLCVSRYGSLSFKPATSRYTSGLSQSATISSVVWPGTSSWGRVAECRW